MVIIAGVCFTSLPDRLVLVIYVEAVRVEEGRSDREPLPPIIVMVMPA